MNTTLPAALRRSALLIFAIAAMAPGAHAQERIEVFQLSTQHLRGTATATVYYVDAIERADAALSAGLPPDATEAAAIAKRRFESLSAADRQAIAAGARGLAAASRYRLTKVPAIVFDGAAVVYGVDDVEKARALYRAWRARGG